MVFYFKKGATHFAGKTEFIKFEGESEIFHYHKWQTVKKKKKKVSAAVNRNG